MKNHKIQIMRAVFAIMVVFIHSLPIGNDMIRIYLRPFCNVAVAGFIFFSGYLTKMDFEIKKLYLKRITAVLVPFIIFTALYTAIARFDSSLQNVGAFFVRNLITMRDSGPLYYLVVYMQLVLLTPLLVRIAKNKSWIIHAVVMAIQPLFVACLYLGFIEKNIFREGPFYMMVFPMWILYYYLGVIIGNGIINNRISTKVLLICSFLGVLLQIGEGLFWLNNSQVNDLYYSQVRFSAMIENIPLLLLVSRYVRNNAEKGNAILYKIGNASYGIYLLHWAFIMVCDKLIPRTEATFLLTFAFAAAGSFVTILILNKLLPRKLLKPCGLALAG